MLPCFDEEDNVAAAVAAAGRAAARVAASYEIVVVDDGSRDRTAAIAAALASTDRHVRLLRHPRNRGYGAAVRSGLAAARMPWLFLTDADLQFDLDELERFVAPARTADLVAGWRIARSTRSRAAPTQRRGTGSCTASPESRSATSTAPSS